jgi:hypothetical protein
LRFNVAGAEFAAAVLEILFDVPERSDSRFEPARVREKKEGFIIGRQLAAAAPELAVSFLAAHEPVGPPFYGRL